MAEESTVDENEVSVCFRGAGKKFDTEEDIQPICDALDQRRDVTKFCLQGNTLGSAAAKSLGESLSQCSKLERLLCEDIFTGRMKSDIPVSLNHISDGLMQSGCQLAELDFTGNAFGELAINAMYELLTSETCFSLKTLRLHNTGLGPSGGVRLASALLECLERSGHSFQLQHFICGRSRLENDGAKALAEFFAQSLDLRSIYIPQNGIFKEGIVAICDALVNCPKLESLNMNDNILSSEGAFEVKDSLAKLTSLRVLDIGDCVLKSEGAAHIAEALVHLTELKEVYLDHNEIGVEAGLQIVEALKEREDFSALQLDGNCFGREGIAEIEDRCETYGLLDALWSFAEDDADTGDDDDCQENEGLFTFDDFAYDPTLENLFRLENAQAETKEYLKKFQCLDHAGLLRIYVKIASSADASEKALKIATEGCLPVIQQMALLKYEADTLINLFAVHLGFVKDENKVIKAPKDMTGILLVTARFKDLIQPEVWQALKTFVQHMDPVKVQAASLQMIKQAYV